MNQRLILSPLLYLLLILGACKKDDAEPKSFSDKIVLQDTSVVNDSVQLSWSALDNKDFTSYTLLRRTDPSDQFSPIANGLYLPQKTTFTDARAPYSAYLEYQVVVWLKSGTQITSNSIQIKRADIQTINVQPFDARYDDVAKMLYFFSADGTITQYNTQTKQVTKTIKTAATIGYCDFGNFNGVKELYVPRNDGWVFIYNALTLEKIDQISVGSSASCVVANNNQLYVSTAGRNWINRPLKVYGRAAKNLLSETGDWDATRFKLVPGTNTDLLEITLNIGPTDQHYYQFDVNGNIINQMSDRYHGDYPLDASIFELFPSGNKYITSASGAIYNKDMVYEGNLPRGSREFTSFAFNAGQQLIYGGTTTKTVEVYTISAYSFTRSIPTKGYPFRLFHTANNELLCVSATESFNSNQFSNSAPNKLLIEILK